VANAGFGATPYAPADLEVVAGNLAVLGTSTLDDMVRVQTRTPDGVRVGVAKYGTQYSGIDLEVVGTDVGVLGVKPSGKTRVQIRTIIGSVVSTIYY
jgi:hypothetical protein